MKRIFPSLSKAVGAFRFAFATRQQFRGSSEALGEIPITTPAGAPIPLSQLAEINTVQGPTMISSENGLLRGTVLLNVRGRDVGSFVDEAKQAIANQVQLPAGYYIEWSGQYENQQRARSRLLIVVPIVLIVIFGLLYLTYHSALEAAHVLLAVRLRLPAVSICSGCWATTSQSLSGWDSSRCLALPCRPRW